jgi:anaerobic ribonucleoside-triphosphate reductase
MNELLETKLTIGKIKVKLMDLVGELIADDLSDKDYAIKRILTVVEYIDEYDEKVKEINATIT